MPGTLTTSELHPTPVTHTINADNDIDAANSAGFCGPYTYSYAITSGTSGGSIADWLTTNTADGDITL